MKELNKEELNDIIGGAIFSSKWFLVGGIITFIIGVLDGFVNLKKCEN